MQPKIYHRLLFTGSEPTTKFGRFGFLFCHRFFFGSLNHWILYGCISKYHTTNPGGD